jgi:hypothetical protein
MRRLVLPVVCLAIVSGSAVDLSGRPGSPVAVAAHVQIAPPAAAPLDTDAQLAFLKSAKVVKTRPIGKGITGALRVTLTDGVVTHDAAFQSIATEPKFDGKKRAGEMRFADHYRYNLAAWRLAALLGLGHMMPATVERTVQGKPGALSWWVDNVAMDEAERETKNAQPPGALEFSRQRQRMTVFAELVRDMDRNKGNVVYTTDWRVVMLDFTRAFRLDASLRAPTELATCDRALLAAMKAMTPAGVKAATDGALRDDEMKAVLSRRDLLVQHYEQLVAKRGEAVVLY